MTVDVSREQTTLLFRVIRSVILINTFPRHDGPLGPLGLSLNVDKTAVWAPDAGARGVLPASLRERWAFHLPVLGSALPYVRASYPEAEDSDPALEAAATERAVVALNAFQASLLELRSAGLRTLNAQKLHRIYVNGAVTHLLRGSLLAEDWCIT